ncbi:MULTISPECIES: hypothetical protein [Comamonas]|uniref:hypothetical protein n=1 Tax=Comamonas TaxID=283 RepID=UPI00237DE675|nr:hypothetical protein [Comamonas aquatica]MDE1554007.1 hypothetical protein [Comamonas aquatica]
MHAKLQKRMWNMNASAFKSAFLTVPNCVDLRAAMGCETPHFAAIAGRMAQALFIRVQAVGNRVQRGA